MYLPEQLQYRRFTEWNYLVRGLMTIWEMARLAGLEEILEERLRRDGDGELTERLGKIGNDCAGVCSACRRRALALTEPPAIEAMGLLQLCGADSRETAPCLEEPMPDRNGTPAAPARSRAVTVARARA